MKNLCAGISLLAALAAFAASGFRCEDGLYAPEVEAWVATEPVQCLTNPWEQDWLKRHGDDYGAYPRDLDSQKAIVVEYYAGIGVEVRDQVSIFGVPMVCLACSCPRGDTLYLLVPEGDVLKMIFLGYRREAPPPPG